MEVTKSEFNKVATHPLQTWEWGEFRKDWGNQVYRLPFGQISFHKIPKTKYKIGAFIRGPKPTGKMLRSLKTLAEENNLIFIKLEPNFEIKIDSINGENIKKVSEKGTVDLLLENGAKKGKTLFTPTTFQIDLDRSEDEIMKSFSSKTRYNIKLAQKKGVKVIEDNSSKAFDKYLKLTRETVERQGFYAHTKKYHELMWEHLHTDKRDTIARLITARYKNEIIATWIVFVWKNYIYYPYGASTHKYKETMANNLMMWETIKYGKENKLKIFDLWGREPGKGFTKFKEGYSPNIVEFVGTWDLITSNLYVPYQFVDKIRWTVLRSKSKFVKPNF